MYVLEKYPRYARFVEFPPLCRHSFCSLHNTRIPWTVFLLVAQSFRDKECATREMSEQLSLSSVENWVTRKLTTIVQYVKIRWIKISEFTFQQLSCNLALQHPTSSWKVRRFIVILLGQFCPRVKGAMRLTLCEAPTHEVAFYCENSELVIYGKHFSLGISIFAF